MEDQLTPPPLAPDWQEPFLAVLKATGNVSVACEAVGINRRTPYKAREKSPEFADLWGDAIEHGTDALESEARRRAMDGSDFLLSMLLKAHRPSVYRETIRNEVTGADGEATRIVIEYADAPPRDAPAAPGPG